MDNIKIKNDRDDLDYALLNGQLLQGNDGYPWVEKFGRYCISGAID